MEQYIVSIKENITYQDSNEMFKSICIKIMRCKIVRPAYVAIL